MSSAERTDQIHLEPSRSGARRFLRRSGFLIGALAILFFMLWRFEHSQVYHPDRVLDGSRSMLPYPSEDVWFQARDGTRLNGWLFTLTNTPATNAPVVLHCHGNAGNISHRLGTCAAILEAGAHVFVFDYRGYGLSEGRPSEEGTYRDAQAAHAWLRRRGFSNIIVFGESLGGGVAAETALREPVSGLVLQATFTSIPAIGAELFPWLPVKWLARIRYDTLSKLPRVQAPVLVMHSRQDTLIRYHHAEANFAAAREPKMFCELEGDHNDTLQNRAAFIEGLRKFLALCAPPPATNQPTLPIRDGSI